MNRLNRTRSHASTVAQKGKYPEKDLKRESLFFSLLVVIDFFSLAPFFFVVCYLDSNVAIIGNRYLEPRACHSTPRSVPMSPEIVKVEVPFFSGRSFGAFAGAWSFR